MRDESNPPGLPPRPARAGWAVVLLCLAPLPGLRAATPPLLATAIAQWTAGSADLAFTQRTRVLLDAGGVKEERVERYDPSLPDSQRWRLLEVDGRPASSEQRAKWEAIRNRKPRKPAVKAPGEYLDLEHAALLGDSPRSARFGVGLRPEAMRLLAVERIAIIITVDKASGRVARVGATLRQPIPVLLGLARITGLEFDLRMEPAAEDAARTPGEVQTGSLARVTMSKLGAPMEYTWSDFKRVPSFGASDHRR
jgi:hypothetical protein